ncbi:hypothetical protein LINPERHAP2_LOCUS1447 [Linum perenne]
MNINLADQTVRHPKGIAENVIVRVPDSYFITNFVVIDCEKSINVPLILGRPFLATSGALIDAKAERLTFRDNGKVIIFEISPPDPKLHPSAKKSMLLVDAAVLAVSNN